MLQLARRGADDALGAAIPADAAVLATSEGADDLVLNELAPAAGGRVRLDRGGGFAKPSGPWLLEGDALERCIGRSSTTGDFGSPSKARTRSNSSRRRKPPTSSSASTTRATTDTRCADSFGAATPSFPREADLVVAGRRPWLRPCGVDGSDRRPRFRRIGSRC
jgi:hypothetical protein